MKNEDKSNSCFCSKDGLEHEQEIDLSLFFKQRIIEELKLKLKKYEN
jgi:hypothetical protein